MQTGVSKNKLKKTFVSKKSMLEIFYRIALLVGIYLLWHFTAKDLGSDLLLPMPSKVIEGFLYCLTDPETIKNVFITMQRVMKGFGYALVIGLPIGFIMGFSSTCEKVLSPVIDSVRQVPIMSWVPLTIVWFGIGDGPTIFLIAFSGIFSIVLNTIHGVRTISKDYYNAAKSMGASPFIIFKDVIFPAALPDILTGARLAISNGWMSVIWAEFIATSAGIGYSMVQAQTLMQTHILIGLMIFAAIIGFLIDRVLKYVNKLLCKWRFAE